MSVFLLLCFLAIVPFTASAREAMVTSPGGQLKVTLQPNDGLVIY